MGVMLREGSALELRRAQASRDELVERLARAIQHDGTLEPLGWLRLRRASFPTELGYGVSDAALCVIAQGSKEAVLGTGATSTIQRTT